MVSLEHATEDSVALALVVGYRQIDTAQVCMSVFPPPAFGFTLVLCACLLLCLLLYFFKRSSEHQPS